MPRKSAKQPATVSKPSRLTKPAAVARQRRATVPVAKTSKAQTVVAALQHPDGATLADLVKATGWQAHSVRGVPVRHGAQATGAEPDG